MSNMWAWRAFCAPYEQTGVASTERKARALAQRSLNELLYAERIRQEEVDTDG